MATEVPYGRILAEAEAWPLSSRYAYGCRVFRLGRASVGMLDADTERLAEGLSEHLRAKAGGASLAGLAAIRDKAWFGADTEDAQDAVDIPLAKYVIRLANAHLERAGTGTVLRADRLASGEDAAARAGHWRWLSLRIPADLLIAAAYATDGEQPPSDHVSLATSHLARILREHPVADTHLHAAAGVGFPVLWTSLMLWLTHEAPSPALLDKHGPLPFEDGERFRFKLLAAALGRFILGEFLYALTAGRHAGKLVPFLESALPALCEGITHVKAAKVCLEHCHRALSALYGKHEDVSRQSFNLTQRVYAALAPVPTTKPGSLAELLQADPLWTRLRPPAHRACAETLFAARGLQYLAGEGAEDRPFAELFWQYQRVRCLTHGYLVQEPGTSGLDWFARHFHRIKLLRSPALKQVRYEAALRHQSVELTLGASELRITPDKNWDEIRLQAQLLAQAGLARLRSSHGHALDGNRANAEPPAAGPELGLILHLLKSREASNPGRLHADPIANLTNYRFGSWYRSAREQAQAIQTAISVDHHPELLLLLRGLDVASSEREIPTWVVAPLLKRVRDESVRAAMVLRRRRPAWSAAPLRLTFHAGEEFTRLISGLRQVHELLETGLLKNGDRIGHGLALGRDPRRWAAESSAVILQTLDERLEDLVWEWDRYGRGDVAPPAGRVERLRAEVSELAGRVYGKPIDLESLSDARFRRHKPGVLEALGYPDKPAPISDDPLLRYLCAPDVFRRGQQLKEVRAEEPELQFLEAVQRWMSAHLARLEITIEANPSSNLLIGDLLGLEEHPVFRLTHDSLLPSREEGRGAEGLRVGRSELLVSINSDDPITFATRLADEYAYLYFALLRREVPAARALSWLDDIREHGMRSRFTLGASTVRENLQAIVELGTASR